MRLKRDSMLYATALLTCASVISQVMAFLYRIVLTRLIGAENMGLYQLIMPVYSVILSIASVGLSVAVSRLSAEYRALNNPRAVRAVLRQCLGIFAVIFAAVAVVTTILSDPISVYLLGDARTQMGLLLLLPCVLLTGIENLHKHYFYGTNQVRPPALVELCEQGIRIGAVLALLILFQPRGGEKTVAMIVAGMIICEIFSAVTLFFWSRKRLRGAGAKGEALPGPLLRRKVASVATPIALTSLLGNLIGSVNAVILPQRLVRAGVPVSEAMSSFGVLFGMALPMISLPTAFLGAFGLILVPRLSAARMHGDKAEIRRIVSRTFWGTAAIAAPAMTAMLFIGPLIAVHWFREPSIQGYLPLLAVGMFFTCLRAVLGSILNGLSRERISAASTLGCDLLELAFAWFGAAIPGVGLDAFLWGFCFGGILGLLWNGACVLRELRIRW